MNSTPALPPELISEARLRERITELAAEIQSDYEGGEPPVFIGVLKGSVFFLVDLLKEIQIPLHVDFLQTSSYGSGTEPGEVRILKDVDISIRGRDVILVEDIVDTGFTLNTILALFRFRKAKSVRLCALLDKKEARKAPVQIDYCGFEIQDQFVVGYGLDVDESYRNLTYIGVFDGD